MSSVKKFMSPAPVVLNLNTTLEDAAKVFVSKRITSIPVLDDKEVVAGVITDFIMVKMYIRSNGAGKTAKIGDFREELDPVIVIDGEETVYNAFKFLVQSPNHRVFAIENGKLSGALSPKDILPFLVDEPNRPRNFEQELGTATKEIQRLTAELNVKNEILKDYSVIFDNSPYMLHSVNFNGKIVRANKLAHIVLGYEPGQLTGKDVTEIYPANIHKEVMDALDSIQSLGYNPLVTTTMVRQDGSTIKAEVASMLKKDGMGNPECTISVSRPAEFGNMIDYLRLLAAG